GGRAEDLSLLISRSNVCHLAHRFDDGALELELRILSVRDEVKAIRDGAGLERLAVASGEGGTEFGFVRVGRLVQVDVHQDAIAPWGDKSHQRGGLLGVCAVTKRSIRIDRVRIPTIDPLVAPRAHARRDQQIDTRRKTFRMPFHEPESALHAARLVAVHAPNDQCDRKVVAPVPSTYCIQRIAIRRIVELSVRRDVEACRKLLNSALDVVSIAALSYL